MCRAVSMCKAVEFVMMDALPLSEPGEIVPEPRSRIAA